MDKTAKRKIHSIFSVQEYIVLFLMIAAAVTVTFFLFFGLMDRRITFGEVRFGVLPVFGNLLFVSLLLSILNGLYRKNTIEKPVRKILSATEAIADGNFDYRIEKESHALDGYNEFDLIIDNLNLMAKELSGTEILRNDFITNVSHELKSPLAAIQNYCVLLQDPGIPDEKKREYAKAANASCERLSSLITNILKLNKLENQQIYPEKKKYNLSEQLCACMLDFEAVWDRKKIDIDTDIEQDIYVEADEELLSLVWNNLLSNALKFTDEGGRVFVSLKPEDGKKSVIISDNGCGIPDEAKGRIFEKFYQGDTSHSAAGNGLGLALVKKVMDMTGGKIEVESSPGKGSTFKVLLE